MTRSADSNAPLLAMRTPPRLQPIDGEESRRLASAEALAADGRVHEAVAELTTLLEMNPELAIARSVRGALLHRLGDTELARDDLRIAARLEPQDPVGWERLAEISRECNDHRSAQRAAQRAIDLDRSRPFAWRLLGQSRLALGEARKAIDALLTAASLDDNATTWIALSVAYRELQRLDESLEAARHARRLRPSDYDQLMSIGAVLEQLLATDEASAHYRDLMRRYPLRWEHLRRLARLESAGGSWATALMLLNVAIRLAPNEAAVRADLAEAYRACGRDALAAELVADAPVGPEQGS